eukprot:Awhi_evm1s13266
MMRTGYQTLDNIYINMNMMARYELTRPILFCLHIKAPLIASTFITAHFICTNFIPSDAVEDDVRPVGLILFGELRLVGFIRHLRERGA